MKPKVFFHGRAYIHPSATDTTCRQSAKNLLLSDKAHSCIQPELAIDCSKVQAEHGSAVGSLNPDELFYLQTRGMDAKTAKEFLIFAYIKEVFALFPQNPALENLNQMIQQNKNTLLNLKPNGN